MLMSLMRSLMLLAVIVSSLPLNAGEAKDAQLEGFVSEGIYHESTENGLNFFLRRRLDDKCEVVVHSEQSEPVVIYKGIEYSIAKGRYPVVKKGDMFTVRLQVLNKSSAMPAYGMYVTLWVNDGREDFFARGSYFDVDPRYSIPVETSMKAEWKGTSVIRATVNTPGCYDRPANHDVHVLTVTVAECQSHGECNSGEYCDQDLNCWDCKDCSYLNDAIDGSCDSCNSLSPTYAPISSDQDFPSSAPVLPSNLQNSTNPAIYAAAGVGGAAVFGVAGYCLYKFCFKKTSLNSGS